MNSWFVWMASALVALVLGLMGYHFSLRVLRVTAAFVTLATVAYITWYGWTHQPAKAHSSFSDALTRGADALSLAFVHHPPVPPGQLIPGPGRIGWLIIAVLLVIGYRELEAWCLHCHARCLDTSELVRNQPNAQHKDSPGDGEDALTDVQRHDRLAAELKFRLPAVEVRSPAILPGGSRSGELASIAETSGVTGSGLAGAVIRFFGLLWPSPRRARVRVWVEWAAGRARIEDVTKVTVSLDDPGTGASIATKTLAAGSLDDAASVVAGYVARHIFAEDPTAPPWCSGAADGGDLAALLLARQVRVHPESAQEVKNARRDKIELLKKVASNNLCAGVARYELAHLYDLTDRHVDALLLHVKNREQYPRFYRGRYRLAMSLEMIANPDPGTRMNAAEVSKLDAALSILHRCGATGTDKSEAYCVEHGKFELTDDLRSDLLKAAWTELQAIRKYLTLRHVIWRSFWHRDERGILKPYWQLRYRQGFHDGTRVALLLVAVRRQALIDKKKCDSAHELTDEKKPDSAYRLPHARTVMRIANAIVVDSSDIATALVRPGKQSNSDIAAAPGTSPDRRGKQSKQKVRPLAKRLRTRRRPGQCSTLSPEAAYNLACVYAAIAQDYKSHPETCRHNPKDAQAIAGAEPIEAKLTSYVSKVVTSLEFAINNRESEMERPWEWISHDPDFRCLCNPYDQFSKKFRDFLTAQKQRDYPTLSRTRHGAVASKTGSRQQMRN